MSSPVNGPGGNQWAPQSGPIPQGYQQPGSPSPYPAAPPPPGYLPGQPQVGSRIVEGLRNIASTLRTEGGQAAQQMGGSIRRAKWGIGSPEGAIASGRNVQEAAAKANVHHQLEIHDLEAHSVEGPAGQAAYTGGANVVQVINHFGIQSPANVRKLLAKAAEGLIFNHGMSIAYTRQHLVDALHGNGWPDENIAALLPDIEELAIEGPARQAIKRGYPPDAVAARMGIDGEENQSRLRVHAAVTEIEASNIFTLENIKAAASRQRVSEVRVGIALARSGIEHSISVAQIIGTVGLPESSRPELEAHAVASEPVSSAIRNGESLLTIAGRYDIRDLAGSGLIKAALNGPARHALRQGLNRPQTIMEVSQRYGIPPLAVQHCSMQLAVARGTRPDAFGMVPPNIRRDLMEICAMGPMLLHAQRHGVPLGVAAQAYGIDLQEIGTIRRNGL